MFEPPMMQDIEINSRQIQRLALEFFIQMIPSPIWGIHHSPRCLNILSSPTSYLDLYHKAHKDIHLQQSTP